MKSEQKNYELEQTTVWSFPNRGNWATHSPGYRGNFAPQVARNIILRYSREGDIVLDPMVGGGTTLIEAKLLNRRGIGYDINPEAVKITRQNLNFSSRYNNEQLVKLGDAGKLDEIEDNSIDLILTHPPYLNIIKYSAGKLAQDLSNISDVKTYCDRFELVIKEFHRVLKTDSYCAILIGDTRKSQHHVPLSYYILDRFLKNNFVLKENIIKVQNNCSSNAYWRDRAKNYNFLLIMHEHLFVFRKPKCGENITRIKYSTGI